MLVSIRIESRTSMNVKYVLSQGSGDKRRTSCVRVQNISNLNCFVESARIILPPQALRNTSHTVRVRMRTASHCYRTSPVFLYNFSWTSIPNTQQNRVTGTPRRNKHLNGAANESSLSSESKAGVDLIIRTEIWLRNESTSWERKCLSCCVSNKLFHLMILWVS